MMSFFGKKKQAAAVDLQKINEEIYKHNADLAVKNRTLSLLYKLYDIATHTSGVDELVRELTSTVLESLRFPFLGILAGGTGQEKNMYPLIASGVHRGDVQTFFTSSISERDKSLPLSREVIKKLRLIERREAISRNTLGDFYRVDISDWPLQKDSQPLFLSLFPLLVNKEIVGFMVIGLDADFATLSEQEQGVIENIKNVLAVSLDNAVIYNDLLTANERLKELDRQKTEFLSIASHQLRTPLSIIKGYIELIQDGAYGKITKKTNEVLVSIDESNERLVKLVDDFLDVSRIEQGRTKFVFVLEDMRHVITPVIDELRQRAEAKGLSLTWKSPAQPVSAVIDKEKIHHVVFNYIDNAIKYTEKGTVTVDAREEHNGVLVSVKDTGIGFNEEDLPNFFNKFYRGNNVRGTNVNGTGLGIYVCRQFVEGHHGKVWAKSDGLGEGSEFGFWVPFDAEERGTEPLTPSDARYIVNQYG